MSERRISTILIVDDNPQNLQLLGSLLQPEGYEVVMAMNGNEALDYLEKELPHLVLLDVMMPELDGYQVCTQMKKERRTRNVPVIFLTAKTEPEDVVHGFECGGVDYVSKPFEAAELLARVKTHIELKRAREEILTLKGMLPICASCKKIRDDEGFWHQVETYLASHTDARFTHGICTDCYQKEMARLDEYIKRMDENQ